MRRGWVVTGLLVLLFITNLLMTRIASDASFVVALVAIPVFLLVALALGLTWDDLGLARDTWARGLRWGGTAIGVVVAVYTVLLLVPAGRSLLTDDRAPDTLGAALLEAFVVIPVRTVVLEELAFRGVLWAYLRREWSTRVATIGSSVAFGFWHVLPAIGFADASDAAGDALGESTGATVIVVMGTVLVTGLAGVVLCEMRRRSGSLLAPMGLHWATNGPGTIAAYLAR